MNQEKKVVFFTRAYNDCDTQMALIDSLSTNTKINVKVVSYPFDGNLFEPKDHELAPIITKKFGTSFSTILDTKHTNHALKLLHKINHFFETLRKNTVSDLIFNLLKPIHLIFLLPLRSLFKYDFSFYSKALDSLNPDLIILDEAFAMTKRSVFLDNHLREYCITKGIKSFMIFTGQTNYLDAFPNKSSSVAQQIKNIGYIKTPATKFIVPSDLDKIQKEKTFRNEDYLVLGNLRMDPFWIRKIHNDYLKLPSFNISKNKNRLPLNDKQIKIAIMLSKMGYGVNEKELQETVERICSISGLKCVIKPHTRGMNSKFLKKWKLGDCSVVGDIPSAEIIGWSDLILFTSSGIILHGVPLGKQIGMLSNCINIETIFDNSPIVEHFRKSDDLVKYLEEWKRAGQPPEKVESKTIKERWLSENFYYNSKSTLKNYTKYFLNELGL